MQTGLLLIAHGSRRGAANDDLEHLADALRKRGPHAWIQCGYLELATPDIATAAERLVASGPRTIVMVPYFLSAGVHVTRDLETARRQLAEKHPGVEFLLAAPIGRHPLILEIVTERVAEAERAAEECGRRIGK